MDQAVNVLSQFLQGDTNLTPDNIRAELNAYVYAGQNKSIVNDYTFSVDQATRDSIVRVVQGLVNSFSPTTGEVSATLDTLATQAAIGNVSNIIAMPYSSEIAYENSISTVNQGHPSGSFTDALQNLPGTIGAAIAQFFSNLFTGLSPLIIGAIVVVVWVLLAR